MSKALVDHTDELLAMLRQSVARGEQGDTLLSRRYEALRAAAICKAIISNMEVQSASFENVAEGLYQKICSDEKVKARVNEMSEAEM